MRTDEIDEIIAKALEEDKQKKGRSGKSKRGGNKHAIRTIRKWLNIIFMIGFAAAVIVYFALPEQRALFFGLGFGSMLLKIVEFFLRFMF